MNDNHLVDVDEAARILQMHRESLLRGIRRGEFALEVIEKPTRRAARKYFFRRKQVEDLKMLRRRTK